MTGMTQCRPRHFYPLYPHTFHKEATMTYLNTLALLRNPQDVPQSLPLPGMIANSAGGYAFPVSKWERLLRFLILGSDQGSYYASARELTLNSLSNVISCYEEDFRRTLETIEVISVANRAPRRLPAIVSLSLAFLDPREQVRKAAADVIPSVIRTGTDMADFIGALRAMKINMGRVLRRGIAAWYTSKSPNDLVYTLIKYKQRNGVHVHDVFNLVHPKPQTAEQEMLFRWVVRKETLDFPSDDAPFWAKRLWAAQEILKADVATATKLIEAYKLPREVVPTQLLGRREVWEALFPHMPLTAMIRNLNVMAKHGLFDDARQARVVERLTPTIIIEAGIHPITILKAYTAFEKNNNYPEIKNALERAFYAAFGCVIPTRKRLVVAIDVSASMRGSMITPTLSAHVAASAMALIFKATEPYEPIYLAFAGDLGKKKEVSGITPLKVHGKSLSDFMESASMMMRNFTVTDCSLPMRWALQNDVRVDAFIVLTDNETWAGEIHPVAALAQYRARCTPDAALVVVAMTANNVSIADPNDARMLDVVGFDTAAPEIINAFISDTLGATFACVASTNQEETLEEVEA